MSSTPRPTLRLSFPLRRYSFQSISVPHGGCPFGGVSWRTRVRIAAQNGQFHRRFVGPRRILSRSALMTASWLPPEPQSWTLCTILSLWKLIMSWLRSQWYRLLGWLLAIRLSASSGLELSRDDSRRYRIFTCQEAQRYSSRVIIQREHELFLRFLSSLFWTSLESKRPLCIFTGGSCPAVSLSSYTDMTW